MIDKEQRDEAQSRMEELKPYIDKALDVVFPDPFQGQSTPNREFSENENNVFWTNTYVQGVSENNEIVLYGFVDLGIILEDGTRCQEKIQIDNLDDISPQGVMEAVRKYADNFDIGKCAVDLVEGFYDRGEQYLKPSERYEPRHGSLNDAIQSALKVKEYLSEIADKLEQHRDILNEMEEENLDER